MNQTIDPETARFFSTASNISQLREDADWCENRCRYLDWEEKRARRRLRNVLGLGMVAATIALVYLLGIGSG